MLRTAPDSTPATRRACDELIGSLVERVEAEDVLRVCRLLREMHRHGMLYAKQGIAGVDKKVLSKLYSAVTAASTADYTLSRRLLLELLLLNFDGDPSQTTTPKTKPWAKDVIATWQSRGRRSATEALALLKMNAVARKRWIAANLPPLPTTVSSAPPPPLNNRHNSLPPLRVSPLPNRQPMLSPPPITLPPRAEAAAPLSTSPAIYHPPSSPHTKRDSQRRSRSWDEERFAPLSKRRGGDLEERDERSRRPPPPRRSSSPPIKAPLRTGSSPPPLNAESTSEWGRNRDVPFGEASVALPYGQDDDLFGSYRHSTVANDKSHSTSEVELSESQGSVEEGEVCEENKPRRDSGVAFVSPEPEVKVEDQEQGLEEQEQELEPKAMVVKLEFEVDEPEEAQMAKVDIPRSLPPPSPFLAPATEPEVPNIFALPPLLKVQPASSPDKPVIDASSPDKFDAASSLLTLSRLSTSFSASTSRSNSSPYPSPEPSPPPASHPAKVARSKLSSPTPSSSHTIFPGSALTESPLGEDNPFAGIFGVGSRAASSSSAGTAPIARPVSIFAPQPSKKRASTWDKALKPRRGSLKRKAAEDAGEGEEGGQGRRKKKVNWAPDDLLAVARGGF